jgi:hypothetical protein
MPAKLRVLVVGPGHMGFSRKRSPRVQDWLYRCGLYHGRRSAVGLRDGPFPGCCDRFAAGGKGG